MFLLTILIILISLLLLLFKRNYDQFVCGLRDKPGYFLWIQTRVIQLIGWSSDEHCLRTNHLKSRDDSGYLTDKVIPMRSQARPKMLRGIPHRQLSQHAPDEIMYDMHKHMESISIPRYSGQTLNDHLILRGTSKLEYTGDDGLFIPNPNANTFGQGEFAHIHSNDRSFHMILHPSDTKLLIEKQWAERFPLAGVNFLYNEKFPHTYTMIYGPQNKNDFKVWKTILNAAIQNAQNMNNKL